MSCPKTLKDVVQSQLCTGCGACAAASLGKIAMRETQTTNQRPDFSKSAVSAYDPMLARVCPVTVQNERQRAKDSQATALGQAFGPIAEVYEAYACDPDVRYRGASGGAVTALALASLSLDAISGVLHVRASDEDARRNIATISRDAAAVSAAAGSRYAPASVCEKLPEVAGEPGQVVVIGKPCDIAGVHAVADRNAAIASNIAATISFFCAGTPSHEGTDALLAAFGVAAVDKLESLRYRGHGWPGNMVAKWQNAKAQSTSAKLSYAEGWGEILQQYRQWRCYVCTDHTGEQADISVGDPWQRPTDTDDPGRSLLIVRTPRGRALLDHAIAAGYLVAEPVDPDTLARAQPNLIAAKGNAFGRALALKLAGLKAPVLRRDGFACWVRLSFRQKVQSIIGTWKRIRRKSLQLDHKPTWLDAG